MICEGCGEDFDPQLVEWHFGKAWCPPCDLELLDSYDEAHDDD